MIHLSRSSKYPMNKVEIKLVLNKQSMRHTTFNVQSITILFSVYCRKLRVPAELITFPSSVPRTHMLAHKYL